MLLGKAIETELATMFSTSTRGKARAIAVAFVGADAASLLPDFEGVQIACWPDPRATSARAVKALVRKGASVSFVDRLHCKVYWVDGLGAVVGSPNLSTNGIQEGLREAAVRVPMTAAEFQCVFAGMTVKPATPEAIESLRKLNDLYSAATAAFRGGRRRADADRPPPFTQWSGDNDASEAIPWKLGNWTEQIPAEKFPSLMEQAERLTGIRTVKDYISADSASSYVAGDWVLTYRSEEDGSYLGKLEWLFVHFRGTASTKAELKLDPGYPHKAVQVFGSKAYNPPPFLIDSRVRKAFRRSVADYGAEKLIKRARPSAKFLRILAEHYADGDAAT